MKAIFTFSPEYRSAANFEPEGTGLGFEFSAADLRYKVRAEADAIELITTRKSYSHPGYSAVELDESPRYGAPDPVYTRDYIARTPRSVDMEYAGLLFWSARRGETSATGAPAEIIERRMIYGAKTAPGDTPTCGVANYATIGDYNYNPNASPAAEIIHNTRYTSLEITIDWQTRSLSGSFSFSSGRGGTAGSSANYTSFSVPFSGTISADNQITGWFGLSERGSIKGYLYGPQGVEIGIVFLHNNNPPPTLPSFYTGAMLGRRR